MRFRTRAFLSCFVPFAFLLAASFWIAQRHVQSTVHNELLTSLKSRQLALRDAQAKADLQSSRFLTVEGENSELRSGMQSLLAGSPSDHGRQAMVNQLRMLGEQMDLDLLFVSAPDGVPLAGVMRSPASNRDQKSRLVPLQDVLVAQPSRGLLVLGQRLFQFASVPIDGDAQNFGTLSVGEYFYLGQQGKPAALVHDGKVIDSNLSDVVDTQVDAAMKSCAGRQECDFRLGGTNWIAIPMQNLGGGYIFWSLENVDAATSSVRQRLRSLFLLMEFGSLLSALLFSSVSARAIEKPVALVISQLRNAERTGVLPNEPLALSSTLEMRELLDSYTRAAGSARNAIEKLQAAYVEFIGSLANALDARDRYTAGHSERVAQYASLTAAAMGLESESVEHIRIGAQLHDIGKIGIPDRILQKPGRLTAREFAIVQEHPVIGRRIIEGIEGLAPYLGAVELHHENWDGSGYPKGQSGEKTPIDARIIHVADAYDAMTTHRSYRLARSHEEAMEELIRGAGTQFDPRIVEAFISLPNDVFSELGTVADDRAPLKEMKRQKRAGAWPHDRDE